MSDYKELSDEEFAELLKAFEKDNKDWLEEFEECLEKK